MASAVVGALRVILSLDSAEFDTAMKRVSSSAKDWGNDLTNIGRQATAVGSALTRTLTLPLVGLGLAAVKSASDFESSFAGVRKTVEATEPEFAALAQGLRDMAKEIPVSVTELNKVAESAGQLGIKKGDILAFTRTMADLGVTTNLTADEAATATAQIQNIFGTAGKDVDRFGATLVALGNAGASTEKDIVQMGVRIAKAGTQVGLSQAQVLSFASALSSIGIESEAGGSAISRVFLKINDAVHKGGADLKEFARVAGMSSAQFKQAFQTDAATATVSFIEGLDRLKKSGENVNATLEGVVGKNIILKSTLMGAAGAGQLLRDQLELGNKAWKDNTALTIEANKRYETFQSQLTILWNKLQDVAITFGTALLPMLKAATAALSDLAPVLERIAKGFAELPMPVQLLGVGFVGLVAAAGPAIWIFGQLTLSAGVLTKAFVANGIATRALTAAYGPLAAAGTVIGGSFVTIGALAAGLAAALYQVGKATVDLYNHWQAGGSMWEFLSQKDNDNFVRRWLGLSTGIRKTNIELLETADAAAALGPPLELATFATANLTHETAELSKAEKKRVTDAIELGKKLNELEGKIAEENAKFRAQAIAGIEAEKAAWRDYYNWLGERRMENEAAELAWRNKAANPEWLSKMFVPLKGTVKENLPDSTQWADAWSDMKTGLSITLAQIPGTLARAFEGGGDIWGAVKSLGSQIGSGIGSAIGMAFGGPTGQKIGAALGSLVGPAMEGFKKLFGVGINDAVKKANVEIEKMRQKLLDTYGPLEGLERMAQAVGLSFSEAWGHQGAAGLAMFQTLVDEFEKRWAEVEATRAELNEQLKTTQGSLDGLIQKGKELGYEFGKSGEFIGVNFDAVKAKADEFGVSVEGLGPKFRQQGIDAEAGKIINAFTLLSKAGGDVGGILVGMKDEIGKVVGNSIKFGTTIPKNMEPWIIELMRTDQLIDENGEKITDLSKIKFGEPVATEFEKIADALKEVVLKLQEILNQIAAIPERKTFRIEKEYYDPGPPQGWGDDGGGGERPRGPGTAVGTMGRFGAWFKDWGLESANTMHGVEAVIRQDQAVPFAMDVMSSLGGGMSQASASDAGVVEAIARLERTLLITMPAMSESAARHGAQTSGRRR